ncbi:MAG TPA: hypothetical protein VGX26_02440 [Solirubrobacteraceae bacterium]|nr:hypothetical protein [Solirubrobacteraceae bacterium]
MTIAFLTAFLLLTNYWTGLPSHTHPWGTDVISYQEMALPAPGLPHVVIGSAYTQRFVPHYLVGLFNWATASGIHAAYRILWALCFAGLIGVFARALLALRLTKVVFALSFALFLLNPYSLRESILTPGAVQDLTFVLGLGLIMWGLLDDAFALVLAGSAVAILSRQTALLVAPVAAYWVLRGPGWREQAVRLRRGRAIGVILLTAVLYVATDLLTSSFTRRFQPRFPRDTILSLLVPSHGHISTLASHLGRCAIALIIPTTVILAALLAARLRGSRAERLPFEFYASLLIGAAVIIQPIGVSPSFPGFAHNEQRLVGIGLLPIAVAAAIALRQGQRQGVLNLSPIRVGIALVALMVGSLHHIFTRVGPPSLSAFVALQIVVAAGVFVALVAPTNSSSRRSAPAQGHV